jgi:hypothetical protein
LAQARLGKDVVGEALQAQKAAAQAKKLGELVPAYFELRERGDEFWKKNLRPRSLVEVTRYPEKAWQLLHGEPLDMITRQMIRARRDEIVTESGTVSANRALAALSCFCAWAIDKEHLAGANPTMDIKPLHEADCTRVLARPSCRNLASLRGR